MIFYPINTLGNARTRNEPSDISFINGDNDDRSFLVGDIKGKISFWSLKELER